MMEYTTVLEMLKGIPDDYEQTGDLRTEASYRKARTAMELEDWSSAAALLASVDREAYKRTYRDIENLYLLACENAGIDPYPAADPEGTPAEPTQTPAPPAEETPEQEPTATPTVNPFLVTEDE